MHFVWKRLIGVIPSLAGVVVVTFLLSHALPGDPAAYFAGPAANADSIAQVREKLGLDRSLPEQFVRYVGDLGRGDLGDSLTTGQPVLKDLAATCAARWSASAPPSLRSSSACC
jgi:peptide/nickel transport system permease protein